MIGSSFLDPVLGVDIHWEMVPTPAPVPTPIPNPFTGVIFDPVGLAVGLAIGGAISAVLGAPFQGPVLYWTAFPATNTGTEAKHVPGHILIPPGVSWAPVPKTPKPVIHPGETPSPPKPVVPDNDAVVITGSKTVHVMGSNAARLGDMLLSCSEPVRLPSSVILAVPKGAPILIGGPPALDLLQALLASLRTRFISDSIHSLISRMSPSRFRNFLNRAVCFLTGHPVDVATGRVLTDAVDFELAGPLPLRFERHYSSGFAARDGALGHGWSHTLDQAVWQERGCAVWRTEDGRELEFDTFDLPDHRMRAGDSLWHPLERATLRCLGGGAWEVTREDGVTLSFAAPPGADDGRAPLRSMRSRGGHHEARLDYDALGRLERLTDPAGRVVRFAHDARGRLVRVEMPHPERDGWYPHRLYRYDDEGDLVEVVDSLGASWRFEYATHLLVREADRNGLSFYFLYDGVGQDAWCVRTWGDGGLYDHVLGYDKRKRVTYVTDSLGHTTQYHMAPSGLVVKVVDPLGGETLLEYDPLTLQRSKVTDPAGGFVERGFDDRGRVAWTRDAGGGGTTVEYAGGFPRRVTDAAGASWDLGFTADGFVTHAVASTGDVWCWEWSRGLITRQVAPGPRDSGYAYDERGMLVAERRGEGTQRYELDRWGRVAVITTPREGTVVRRWDTENRLREVVSAAGVAQRYECDPEGNITLAEDATRRVAYRYGLRNRVLARTEAGVTVRYEYDTEGRLVAATRPSGARATFAWDLCGRLVRETGFDGAVRVTVRDKAGRAVTERTPAGVRALRYDPMGRLVEAAHDDGSKLSLARRPDGFVERAARDDVEVRFERDALGRVLREVRGDAEVRSSFAAHGRREVVESSLGARAVAWRDGHGALRALGFGHPGDITGAHLAIERDAAGLESRRTLFGGVTVSTERDVAGRPVGRRTAVAAEEVGVERIEWRGDDQIAAVLDAFRGSRRFEHDESGRLVREAASWGVRERAYDAEGNAYRDAARAGRRYDVTGALAEGEAGRYEYDRAGRRVAWTDAAGGRWRYRWDGFGLLREVERPDGRRVRFEYDAFARRTRKATVRVLADGSEAVERETRFVWDGDMLLHEVAPEGVTTWHWDPDDRVPVARERGGAWWSVTHDPVGSPAEMRDAAGALAWRMQLDAWGVASYDRGGPEDCPWRYPGQYEDPETGLYYNRFRYYDPASGTYLSPDPVRSFIKSPYGYVDDPLTWIDPDGLTAQHHTIPKKLTEIMQNEGMLGSGHNQGAFASTTRPGLAPLADTAGAHAHSQAHAALSHYLNGQYPGAGLNMPNGTQHGVHWQNYVDHLSGQGHGGAQVLSDFHNFYHTWLPGQVAAGNYPLLKNELGNLQNAFDADKNNLSPHCK